MTAIKHHDSLLQMPQQGALSSTPRAGYHGLPMALDDGLYFQRSDGSARRMWPQSITYFDAATGGMDNEVVTETNTWRRVHRWDGFLPGNFKGGECWLYRTIVFQSDFPAQVFRQRLRLTGAATQTQELARMETPVAANLASMVGQVIVRNIPTPGMYAFETSVQKAWPGELRFFSLQMVVFHLEL